MQRRPMLPLIVVLFLLALVPAVGASQPSGPVTIETELSFASFPFGGSFQVTEGAALLGCSGGVFVDIPHGPGPGAIHKIFTCEVGGDGTFTIGFTTAPSPGPGDLNGHWTAWKGTEDFVGVRGQGDFLVVFREPPNAEETLTGTIHFDPQ